MALNQTNLNFEDKGFTPHIVARPQEGSGSIPFPKQAKQSTEENKTNLHQPEEEVKKETSKLVEISRDWRYAKLSTWMMYASTLFSWLNPTIANRSYELPATSEKASIIGKLQDLFLRFRMMGQMTLHADPGSDKIAGDDIAQCNLHNIPAQKFGKGAYRFHAFWSIPSWILQTFVFRGQHSISKPLNTALRIFDGFNRIRTNMFWNLRRMTLGFIPYINGELITGPSSQAYKKLREVSAPIRNTMSQFTIICLGILHDQLEKILPKPLMSFVQNKLGLKYENLRKEHQKIAKDPGGDLNILRSIINLGGENLKNNWQALLTGQHKSILTGEIQDMRIEEPNTPTWYLKSKLFASVLNPFIGSASLAMNAVAMALKIAGELVRGQTTALLSLSQNFVDMGNGAMSVLYMVGEVFDHASKFILGQKAGEFRAQNLYTFGIGLLGMGWRIIKGAAATLAVPGMIFKPLGNLANKVLHSKLDNILDPLFLLFFSVNRDVALRGRYAAEEKLTTREDRKTAEKDKGLLSVLWLIPRILLRDKEVTYDHPEAIARAEALAAA